ncbi:uncharacterized protein [Gossypium hirsutum]|uniref:Gag-pro-like protein n=1 Tax=Gossypium hirsutum TaxID=3635 RepID=A0ABM3ASL9_GOSHI|nr:uncharacterized protein LOC121222043 [Gossypium hirsutum]
MDKMIKSQGNIMTQLTQLLAKGKDKGKGHMANVEEGEDDGPLYPPGFTPLHVQTQAEVYPRKLSITIGSQQFQAGATRVMNFQTGLGSNPKNNPVNLIIPDFDEPRKVVTNQQGSSRQESGVRQSTVKPQFTPIPMSYKELYQSLFNTHVVSPFYLNPLQPPYPKGYDANAECDYHAGITGYSIENCTAFKKLVERLINMSVVKVDDASGAENPLPNHTDNGVNMISENMGKSVKTNIAEVKTPLKWVWKKMARRGLIISNSEEKGEIKNYFEFHHEVGHEMQRCEEFRVLVQSMMDNKEMEFYEEAEEKRSIYASELMTMIGKVDHPVIIISHPKINEAKNYDSETRGEASVSITKGNQETGSYMCSMKRYNLINARAEPVEGKILTEEQNKEKTVESKPLINEPINEEEAKEFLKFLKHSEYSVVEQLHKQPARISVLALLLSSEVHRSALMKVLNETYMANDISVNKLDRLVNNISADNFIFFNDDEIPSGGMGSTKALHISTQCKGYTLPGVVIDNGFALNVLPLSTLNRLPVDSSHIKTYQNIVRAFDGTERKVVGRIEISLLIGPTIYEVDFLVMDIKPSYNRLLGRPWIHSARVVPSSLHLKLKLVSDGRLVTINAKEGIIASITCDAPYLAINEEAAECSF